MIAVAIVVTFQYYPNIPCVGAILFLPYTVHYNLVCSTISVGAAECSYLIVHLTNRIILCRLCKAVLDVHQTSMHFTFNFTECKEYTDVNVGNYSASLLLSSMYQ